MKKIASFTIDHIKLQPGVYVSRKDPVGDQVITTFDIRMTSPNEEPVMNTAELHAMEHLAATFLRNHKEFGPKVIYWGPMGCRTGNYLLLNGDYESKDIVPLMIEMFEFIRDFEGEIPGASAKDCGNYLDMNLGMAKYLAKKYLNEVLYDIKPDRLVYPEQIPEDFTKIKQTFTFCKHKKPGICTGYLPEYSYRGFLFCVLYCAAAAVFVVAAAAPAGGVVLT